MNDNGTAVVPLGATAPSHGILRHQSVVYNIAGQANVHLGDNYGALNNPFHTNRQTLLSRLSFPYMNARCQHISAASPRTYEWILRRPSKQPRSWDSLLSWLSEPQQRHHTYWICGKPGSGKSTLMKFLDSNIAIPKHTTPWAEAPSTFKCSYYFWSAGNALQRSLEGICRFILVKLLEQHPELTEQVLSECGQLDLSVEKNRNNRKPLCETLTRVAATLSQQARVLLLVDGLDECIDDEDGHDELIELLAKLSSFDSVKLIVSSRPENIFTDAYSHYPALCLEELTRKDIQTYVVTQLQSQRRWKLLEQENSDTSNALIAEIIVRAEGVFLWVVLTVRGIIRSLRDGDDLSQIYDTLSEIPTDLNDYFNRIVESIEPSYRREASVLLQLALYDEENFIRLRPLCLIDTLFISQRDDNFVLAGNFDFRSIDLSNLEAMQTKLEAASRKVYSRCKGLLQCVDDPQSALLRSKSGTRRRYIIPPIAKDYGLYSDQVPVEVAEEIESTIFGRSVELLHRSLRDFLRLPAQQQLLHSYTDGKPIDARRHVYNARLVQLLAMDAISYWGSQMLKVASGVLAAFSVNDLDADTAERASLIRDCIERLAAFPQARDNTGYYITESFTNWHREKSNFLTLTIDFGITSYIVKNLTTASIEDKEGRPILDYLLRPQFHPYGDELGKCFYTVVNPLLVQAALDRGADPNEICEDVSLWALYLGFLGDSTNLHRSSATLMKQSEREAHFQTLRALIKAGAAKSLPVSWVLNRNLGAYNSWKVALTKRWRCMRGNPRLEQMDIDSLVPVGDLLPELAWLGSHSLLELSQLLEEEGLGDNHTRAMNTMS